MPINWNSEAETREAMAVLDQYKAYVTDLGSIGTRYAAVHTLYFTLLGATVAVLGLTESGKLLGGPMRIHVVWIVAAFGVGLCLLWISTVNYYRKLFSAKFKVLRELETRLPARPYFEEAKYLGLPVDSEAAEKQATQEVAAAFSPSMLIAIERGIPYVFVVLLLALAFFAEYFPPPPLPPPQASAAPAGKN